MLIVLSLSPVTSHGSIDMLKNDAILKENGNVINLHSLNSIHLFYDSIFTLQS